MRRSVDQSTRAVNIDIDYTHVVKMDVYYTIRPFKELLVQKLAAGIWKFGNFRMKFVSSHPRPARYYAHGIVNLKALEFDNPAGDPPQL